MSKQQSREGLSGTLTIEAENIGGISQETIDLPPGVSILSGENATNRTSFLQAVMAVFGSNRATLKQNASEGNVTLTAENTSDTYSRTLSRTESGGIAFGGEPYLEDTVEADLYSFLLSDNEVRRTVEQQGDLHDILMRPVDTDAIEAEIEDLKEKQHRLENDIERAEDKAEQLPALEEQKTQLANEIESLKDDLANAEATVEELEAKAEEKDPKSEVQKLNTERNNKIEERDTIKNNLENERENLKAAKEELESLDIPNVDEADLNDQREKLKREKQNLNQKIEELQSLRTDLNTVLELNRKLQSSSTPLEAILQRAGDAGDIPDGPLTNGTPGSEGADEITDQLVGEQDIICKACGSTVEESHVNDLGDQYEALRDILKGEINSLESEKRDIDADISDISDQLSRYATRQTRQEDLEGKITRLENTIEQQEKKLDAVKTEIDELQAEIEALDPNPFQDDLMNAQNTRTNIKSNINDAESDLEDLEEKIEAAEQAEAKIDELEDDREEVVAELKENRGLVNAREDQLVEQFNDTMDDILGLLNYENLARVRIDKKYKSVRGGEETVFDLVITRDEGGAYEDSLDHLSESERNVIGLVVALTGYLVHNVHEDCPIMLLDSIEMIDSGRIDKLVDYFESYTDYLTVVLLPEDANVVSTDDRDTIIF